MSANKKVSVGWQCAAILFWPTGIWAFKRINRFGYGLLLILGFLASSIILNAGLGFLLPWYIPLPVWYLIQFIPPMYFVVKWSKEWNKSIDRQNAQSPTT